MKSFLFFFLAPFVFLAGCSKGERTTVETSLHMGTFVSISLPGKSPDEASRFAVEADRIMEEMEGSLSVFRKNSDVSLLNRSAGGRVKVSDYTWRILNLALKYAEISDGCFDPTAGPLIRLWGFNGGTVPERIPDSESIKAVLKNVGYGRLILRDNGKELSAWLNRKDVSIDLGGIAKGYAVDVCFNKILDMGVSNLMVNAGGNIRCAGESARDRPWTVGVRDPFNKDVIVGKIILENGMAVATSGDYERFVEIEGKRYSHIMDPRTGYPAEGMAGVTVLGNTAVECDAMSTAFFVSGTNKVMEILEKLENCNVLFIPDRHPLEIWITPGFEKYFEPENGLKNRVFVLSSVCAD